MKMDVWKEGFTFVEVVVAVALLVVALAGAFGLIIASMRVRQASHDHHAATLIGNNRLERAKTVTFENVPLMVEHEVRVDELGVPVVNGRFLRTTEVESHWGGNPRLMRVTVTVQPPAHRSAGTRAQATISTLLTEYLEP